MLEPAGQPSLGGLTVSELETVGVIPAYDVVVSLVEDAHGALEGLIASDGALFTPESGERMARQGGKRHYHAMEVQVGPFERRFRLPVVVDPATIRATYEHGFLEIRLVKQPPRSSGAHSVRVT